MRTLSKYSAITVFLFAPALAGADLQKGLAAYDVGDYETAMAECLPLAEAGDPGGQFCVGRMYANGFGAPMDDAQAIKWYSLAAASGHAEAQFNLGVMYANGWGVEMNDEEAAKYYRQAAEQGVPCAARSLAYVTAHGVGVEESQADAYMWYVVAAEMGDSSSIGMRDEFEKKLSAEDLQAAERQAGQIIDSIRGESTLAGRNE
jgi:TPR repeat protein